MHNPRATARARFHARSPAATVEKKRPRRHVVFTAMPRLPFLLCAAAAAALLLSSCSTAFHREWKQAVKAGPRPGLTGAWQGTWRSETCGHYGTLRCVVGPEKPATGLHDFHYHATWAGILSGAYRAEHTASPADPQGARSFFGSHRLPGWAGGLYTYRGSVQGDAFKATYRCAKDHGVFEMTRVK